MIGINPSARSGYSTQTTVWFHFLRAHPLYGCRGFEGGNPQLFKVHKS